MRQPTTNRGGEGDDNVKEFWFKNNCVAFDVSSWSTGWAAWTNGKLSYDCIQPSKEMLAYERVQFLHRVVKDLPFVNDPFQPLFVFIESGIHKHSAATTMLLGEARGAVISACWDASAVIEINPSTWKTFCGAKFKGSKSENEKKIVAEFVNKAWNQKFPITKHPVSKKQTFDIHDAMGILTFALMTKEFEC